MEMEQGPIDTVVIGGGQAGLSMSHHLSKRGRDHVVLERARIGERWRSERWDSLRFQFPNRYVRLPGLDYDGDDPSGFMGRDEVVRFLDRYATHISAPIRTGVDVRSLDRDDDGLFTIDCAGSAMAARNVVVATGPYQRPIVPEVRSELPAELMQLTASSYTNAAALPDGAVLVVGSGGSGVQIAEDLLDAGREVYLCVGKHRRVPRRFRGRDIIDWLEDLGLVSAPVVDRSTIENAPLLTGVSGGYDVDLRALAANGCHLLGRLDGVRDGELLLGGDLLVDIERGDEAYRGFVAMVEGRLAEMGEAGESADLDEPVAQLPMPPEPPRSLGLDTSGITSVIWATGYGLDFSWVHCGPFDADGAPSHERGISPVPGLYVLGLPYLHSARSTVLWGVGDDAEYLAEHLAARGSG